MMKRISVLCLALVACGGASAQSLGTLTRGAAGPFTWDLINTSFTTDASGVKWQNGYTALFSYYGGGSGYPVKVTSSPNGRVEMYGLSLGTTGNWLFYGDEFVIGAGGIASLSSSTDTMNISNRLVMGASQVWKRVYNARDMRVYGDIVSVPGTNTDLTLDAQNDGGYFVLHGSNSYTGSLTLQGLAGLELSYVRGPFSKFDATRPVTLRHGGRFYMRNGGSYTQSVSQLVLDGMFGLQVMTESTSSPVKLKINSIVRNSPYSSIGPDLSGQLILPNEPLGLMGPYICGTTGWASVNADGTVVGDVSGTTIDDPALWTTADSAVNVNATTVTAPAGMYMTNGVMRFGQTTLLNLNGGVLTLTKGGLTRCNQNTVISNGVVRSSAANGTLFVQTSKPWAGAPDFTIAAAIADNGTQTVALIKAGADGHSLFLSGHNTYSGGTYINEGRIIVNGGGNIGGGDLWIAPYDSVLGGSLHRLQFLNNVPSVSRVRNIFAPAAGIMAGGTVAEKTLIVDGWATNYLVEANLGTFNYTQNGPSLIKTAQAANSATLNFTANHPQVTVGQLYLNNLNSQIAFNSSLTDQISCDAQLYSDTTAGIFRFSSGNWRMKNVWYGNSKTWKGTNIVEGSSLLVFSDSANIDNCNGDIFIRENGGFAVARNGLSFVAGNATSGRNYLWDIRDNGSLTVSNGAFNVGGSAGAGATVNQTGGAVSILGSGGDLSLKSVAASPVSTYNLSAGKLYVQNQLKGSNGTVGSRFNWTGGEFAFWAAYTALLENGKLVNNGGVLAPGGVGKAGYSTISGAYEVTSDNAVLAIDIGGTTAASAWQQDVSNCFDRITVAAASSVKLGGRLEVSLRSNFKPLAIQSFTILAFNAGAGNSLTGTFTNVQNGKVLTTDGGYVFSVAVDTNAFTVVLANPQRNDWTGAAGDGNWMTPGNWSGGLVPSAAAATALLDPISTDSQITLGQALTLTGLVLDSKVGRYTLHGTNVLSLSGLTVSSGQHTLDAPVTFAGDAVVQVDTVCSNAGLYFGRLEGNASTNSNPQTSVETALTWAYTTVATAGLTNTPWLREVSQLIYSGYLWNNAATNVVWSFAVQYDDLARLKINGAQVYDVGWNTFAKTNIVLYPGANAFELRLGNYSSGAGPMAGFGPVYDPLGRLSSSASDYLQFSETGQGQLFTTGNTRLYLEGKVTFAQPLVAQNVSKNGVGTLVFAAAADVQKLTLNSGRLSITAQLTVHNGLVRGSGVLDFAGQAGVLKLQKVSGVSVAGVQAWIAAGWFAQRGNVITDTGLFSVKDNGDGYITVRAQVVGTRFMLR